MLKQLDLGSGNSAAFQGHIRRGYDAVAVDIYPFDHIDKVVDLTLENLPYKNDSFELVTCHQTLEHIPKLVYLLDIRRNPIIELFNEVYRVLKHDGEFHFDVPIAGTPQYYGDPTHVSEWNQDSINYYSGDYFGMHDDYGHKSKFKKVSIEIDPERDWHMSVSLKAIKPMEPPYAL